MNKKEEIEKLEKSIEECKKRISELTESIRDKKIKRILIESDLYKRIPE